MLQESNSQVNRKTFVDVTEPKKRKMSKTFNVIEYLDELKTKLISYEDYQKGYQPIPNYEQNKATIQNVQQFTQQIGVNQDLRSCIPVSTQPGEKKECSPHCGVHFSTLQIILQLQIWMHCKKF